MTAMQCPRCGDNTLDEIATHNGETYFHCDCGHEESHVAKPDALRQQTDPQYFVSLTDATGLTQKEIAQRLGVDERTVRRWRSGCAPYVVQFCLEALARE